MIDYGTAIALPFRFGIDQDARGGALMSTSDYRKLWKDRVFVAILTSIRERVMNPGYGTYILQSLFDTEEEAVETCQESVSQAFSTWLPDLTLNLLDVTYDTATAELRISIEYTLPSGVQDTLGFTTKTFDQYGTVIREGI